MIFGVPLFVRASEQDHQLAPARFRFDFFYHARRTPVQKEDAEAHAHEQKRDLDFAAHLVTPPKPTLGLRPIAVVFGASLAAHYPRVTTAGCELRGAVEHTNNRASGVRDRTTTRPPFATVRC